MQLFYLHANPIIAAQFLCDRHIISTIGEVSSMCATAFFKQNRWVPSLRKPTHEHHPIVKWVTGHEANLHWALIHGLSCCNLYTSKFKRQHADNARINYMVGQVSSYWEFQSTITQLAIPEKYREPNAMLAYRKYYIGEKLGFAKWTINNKPSWVP